MTHMIARLLGTFWYGSGGFLYYDAAASDRLRLGILVGP